MRRGPTRRGPTRRGPTRRGIERGFTLTELMVVVAIVGILASLAAVYMRPTVSTRDVAYRLGALFQEAQRRAVTLGPVRPEVAIAQGSRARTKIEATNTVPPTFTVYELVEDAAPSDTASWVPTTSYTMHRDVELDSWAQGIGSHGALTLESVVFEGRCYPDGSCDGRSLFLTSEHGPTRDRQSRLSIMPLGGAVMTRADWN